MSWPLSLPFSHQLLLLYFLLINLMTFFFFGWDKLRSQVNGRRMSEMRLWLLAAIGGSVGALLGMHFFRHKTKKLSFQAGMAMVLAIQIMIIYLILR